MLQAIYYFFVIFKFMYQTVNAVANSQIRQSYQKGGYYKKGRCDCKCDNCPQENKMTEKLTNIVHHTAFNNE